MKQGSQLGRVMAKSSLMIGSLVSLWLIIVGSSYYWNNTLIANSANHLSSVRAVMIHKLADIVFDWNIQHQSVYIPSISNGNNVVTLNTKNYAAISPTEMFQQFTELFQDKSIKVQLISSHSTQSNYQSWQVDLFNSLTKTPKVYFELVGEQFRYMALIKNHNSCNDCLSALSITFPKAYVLKPANQLQQQNAFIHLVLFFLLCSMSILATLKIKSLIQDLQSEKQQREGIIAIKTVNLKQEIKQHKVARNELQRLATHDPLTGIRNRRHFTDVLNSEILRYQRYQNNFSLLILDLDYFKKINDTYGHDCGDHVLIEFAKTIKTCLRKSDIFARYGGEEFVIVATNTQLDSAIRFAQKLCRDISDMTINYRGNEIKITVSIGVSSPILLQNPTVESLISYSEKALYQAKNNGRNCAVSAEK